MGKCRGMRGVWGAVREDKSKFEVVFRIILLFYGCGDDNFWVDRILFNYLEFRFFYFYFIGEFR